MKTDSLFIRASRNRDLKTVTNLLERGVDINVQDDFGLTGLMWACHHGDINMVEFLIQQGANVNLKERYGDTSLILACRKGNLDIVKLLIKEGADVNSLSNDESSSLYWCCLQGNLEIVRTLVQHGADVGVLNVFFLVSLYYSNQLDIVYFLLCSEKLDKNVYENFMNRINEEDKQKINNYIQSINKLKRFRSRVKRYSGMCGLTPKKFYNLNKMIKKREFLEWWYAPEGYGGKRHLENMRRWFSVVHGV